MGHSFIREDLDVDGIIICAFIIFHNCNYCKINTILLLTLVRVIFDQELDIDILVNDAVIQPQWNF